MNEKKSQASEYQTTLEETRSFWRNTAQKLIQESVPSIEKAASQCLTVNAILIGFYFNAVAFSNLHAKAKLLFTWIIFLLPLSVWLISIIFTLGVFWPKAYTINLQSSTGSKAYIEKIVKTKHLRLKLSYFFLVLGILLLLYVLFEYLTGKIP